MESPAFAIHIIQSNFSLKKYIFNVLERSRKKCKQNR